jgi:UDP-N-acetylmuramate--alanine ligase
MNILPHANIKPLPHRYHFVGIGGIGMSALARILLEKGTPVSGSDTSPESSVLESLKTLGAVIYFEQREDNITEPCVVVYSSAVFEDNPEIRAARRRGCPLMHRSELLRDLMHKDVALLVTGTHGKTTTSALLAHLLVQAALRPSFAIGGIVKSLDTNGAYGVGPYFVAEADESDGSFLNYAPFGAIITNIGEDHLNHWKSKSALVQGFKEFAEQVRSSPHLIWCGDDELLRSLELKGVHYGFKEENALRITSFSQQGWKTVFAIEFQTNAHLNIEIPLIGAHNVLNAAAVFGMGLLLHIPEEKIRSAFASFQGVVRRADFKGEQDQIAAYDDYAHHPTEIFATLQAMKRAVESRRLVVIFQPHRYSRTRDLLSEFSRAFTEADVVVLTDIYSAGEKYIEGIDTAVLLKKMQHETDREVHYCPRNHLTHFMPTLLKKNDVFVTMGAGDITKVGPEILEALSIR